MTWRPCTFTGRLWRYPRPAGWFFVTLPRHVADDVRSATEPSGFGSVRVVATVGDTTWQTSVFPDAATGSYLLPVKASVRRREGLLDGDDVTVSLAPPHAPSRPPLGSADGPSAPEPR